MLRLLKKFYNTHIADKIGWRHIYNSNTPMWLAFKNTKENLMHLRIVHSRLMRDYLQLKKSHRTIHKKQQSLIRALGKDYIKKIIKLENERRRCK